MKSSKAYGNNKTGPIIPIPQFSNKRFILDFAPIETYGLAVRKIRNPLNAIAITAKQGLSFLK